MGGESLSKRMSRVMRRSSSVTFHRQSVGKSSARRSSLASEIHIPCFVLPLAYVMNMTAIEFHEVVLEKGVLRPYNPSVDGEMLFISHQWVSSFHPDNEFKQFGVLQDVIRQLMSGAVVRSSLMHFARYGKVSVEKDWKKRLANAVVWFSVPQLNKDNLLRAVESIPAYIEQAGMFMVLCPLVEHQQQLSEDGLHPNVLTDISWASRGWCRMEGVCRLLSRSTGPVIFIHSNKHYEIGGLQDLFFKPVGEGTLACCTLEHTIGGQHIPCDRDKVGLALGKLVPKLLMDLGKSDGTQKEYYFLRSAWPVIFSELPLPDIAMRNVSAADLPLPPLFYKVLARNLDGVKKLVEGRADVNAVADGSVDGGLIGGEHAVGYNVLMAAMVTCRSEQDWPILDYLKAAGVDMSYACPGPVPITALVMAFSTFNREGAKWFLNNAPVGYHWQWAESPSLTCWFPDLAELANQKGMDLNIRHPLLGTDAFARVAWGGHPASVSEQLRKVMGKSYADLQQERAKLPSLLKRVLCRTLYRCGSKHPGIEMIALLDRASLLISAVVYHNPSQVRWLADVVQVPLQAKNKLGMTALDIARKKGYTAIEAFLLDAQSRTRGVVSKP